MDGLYWLCPLNHLHMNLLCFLRLIISLRLQALRDLFATHRFIAVFFFHLSETNQVWSGFQILIDPL